MYDASLGYDPEEWEECPEPEHFLVFSYFTRFILSVSAILFSYYFFKLVEENKNKGSNKKDEEIEETTPIGEKIVSEVGSILGKISEKCSAEPEKEYIPPTSAEQLLQEADQYLKGAKPSRDVSPRRFVDVPIEAAKKHTEQIKEVAAEVYDSVQSGAQHIMRGAEQLAEQASQLPHNIQEQFLRQPDDHFASLHRRPQHTSPERREKKLSGADEEALREWELERERLEQERLLKLQDRMVGGDDSELSNSSRLIEGLLPASHISYHSTSPEEHIQEAVNVIETTPILEKKLQEQIIQIAGAQQNVNKNRESYRDSELTDYDISDFRLHEPGYDAGSSPAADVHFTRAAEIPKGGAPISNESRRTTADSEEYVKVAEDVMYNEAAQPSRAEKAITPEEARQLHELCQEYDFGIDLRTPNVIADVILGQEQTENAKQGQFGSIGDRKTVTISPQEVTTKKETEEIPSYHIHLQEGNGEDPKNVVAAEMFVQDAVEYIGNQKASPNASGFVMEEDMLSSHGNSKVALSPQMRLPSGDATSQMVKTMDVFERVEHDEHDDMTYAPEIQSVEIPPDQMSENSENLQEYFDKAAAEAHLAETLRAKEAQRNVPIHNQHAPQPPAIMSASSARAVSSSSLASGRSGRSMSGFSSDGYPRLRKQSSLLSVLGATSMQEMLLTITSLDALSDAMRKAGLESSNIIFGIDYTASNKYQGEDSFGGRSLHTIHPNIRNPYQQVISILGRTLAPFASTGRIPVYGFGDAKTGDWSTFPLSEGDCTTLEEVLKVYNQITPNIDLSGPTNFAPLIYQAMEICQKAQDYHILVIIADGQVTNERATRRAIVQACQYPLSIIVVGVGDGPWDMMRVFDESLPKRSWDNFHFVEYHEIMKRSQGAEEGDVKLAVQSLLEIPDQYRCICELGLLRNRLPPLRGSEIKREMRQQQK